jgi:PAS domain S-box-containing protein
MLNTENASSTGIRRAGRRPVQGLLARQHALSILIFDRITLRFLSVNEAAIQQYGFTREEFLSMTVSDILQKGKIAQFLSYIGGTAKALMNASAWKHIKRDGTTIDVELMCCKFTFLGKQAMLALTDELTKPMQSKGALAGDLQKYDILEGRATDIISRVERRMKLLELNRELDKLTGMTEAAPAWKTSAQLHGVYPHAGTAYHQGGFIGQHAGIEFDSEDQDAIYLPIRACFPSWGAVFRSCSDRIMDGLKSLRMLKGLLAHVQRPVANITEGKTAADDVSEWKAPSS